MTDSGRVGAVLVACMLLVACRKNAPRTGTPDTTSVPPEAGAAIVEDPLDGPEQALADNATQLRALGVALDGDDEPKGDTETSPRARDENAHDDPASEESKPVPKTVEPAANRCAELCGLADTACELRTQICGLAQDHVGESRYEAACWRANDQCTRASAACDDCKGSTAGAAGSCAPG